MKFSRRDWFLMSVGSLSLGGLGYLLHRTLRRTDGCGDAGCGMSRQGTSDVPRALPQYARNPVLCLDGLEFRVDRGRKTVCAHRVEGGELVWESRGEAGLVVPGAAFPLDLTPDGELWVGNTGRRRLERLDPKSGAFIAFWEPAAPFGGCCNPVRFAALSGGRFVTMEKGTRQARIYGPTGELERVVLQALSRSEFDYYLYREGGNVILHDSALGIFCEVPYDDAR